MTDYTSPFPDLPSYTDVFERLDDGLIVVHSRKLGETQAVCSHWSLRMNNRYPEGQWQVCERCLNEMVRQQEIKSKRKGKKK